MDIKNTRILIVGGTGFIGHHILKKFVQLNFQTYSLSINKPTKYREITGVNYLYENLENLSSLKKKIKY